MNVPIDDELHRRVNAARGMRGMKLREYVEEALRAAVERDETDRGIKPTGGG